MHRLYDARLAQARAGSLSRRVGQRFDSLDAVAQALKIARDLNLGEERLLELRNAAIACLALPDLRITKKWNSWPKHLERQFRQHRGALRPRGPAGSRPYPPRGRR